ncbi:trehalose-phosphatase [Acinetobacter baumannii]|uniref:trehalose-phosphatase n=62 Tax=Acinetobacter baumannii TaxID=470 RepID=UPI000E09C7BF|nr:trehalose-phosphatase [Acinetobacter baumannii]
MTSNITQLKKIKVNHFRGLKNIEINLGDRLTVICGKNGTSKSTILGMIAQIFNFDKNHFDGSDINFKTLAGKNFKSSFREHFRFSKTYDLPGTMDVEFEIFDAYFKKIIPDLKLRLYGSEDRPQSRPVVRDNLKVDAEDNSSRNVTHPLIYLSLKRLMPIAERSKYSLNSEEVEYFTRISREFTITNNRLLGKISGTTVSKTTGTIESAVVHGNNYDHESVSVGEDNTGQILMALFSFQKLKEDIINSCEKYPDLLIEDKEHSIALHYRKNPELEDNAIYIMQQIKYFYPQLKLNRGKFVVELLPKQADKGKAIQTILNHLNLPLTHPIFIGDDLTDETGFIFINQQFGTSIKVGSGKTEAQYRLKDINSVSNFLFFFLEKIKKLYVKNSQDQNGEQICLN